MNPVNLANRGVWTSASNAAADALCPGRHHLQLCVPEITNADAERGQRIHEDLAQLAKGKKVESPEALELWAQVAPRIADAKELWIEERFWLNFEDWCHSGQADLVAMWPDHVLIVDYKTGWSEQTDESENEQLRDLAVLVAENFHYSKVRVVLVQLGRPFSPVEYLTADLNLAFKRLRERVRKSLQPGAPRIAGPLQCKFCRAKMICPEFYEAGLPVARQKLKTSVAMVPINQLGGLLWLSRELSELAEVRVRELLAQNVAVPGWKLTESVGREEITDLNLVWSRFNQIGGTEEQFIRACTLAKSKLRETLQEVLGIRGKELEQELKRLIDGACTIKTSKPKLVEHHERQTSQEKQSHGLDQLGPIQDGN